MDQTAERFAYRCTPLTMANASGWEILNPVGLTATWNGGDQIADISVQGDDGQPLAYAASHFGFGVLTFTTGHLFRTDPGWALWCRGVPNLPKDGIAPLDGIIETDWLPFTFTMNWRFTRPGSVRFEPGEPFCFITPWQSVAVERVQPRLRPLSAEPELARQFRAWQTSRTSFSTSLTAHDPDTVARKWQRFYLNGTDASGVRSAGEDHRIKRHLPAPVADPDFTGADLTANYVHALPSSPPGEDAVLKRATPAEAHRDLNETARLALSLMDGTRTLAAVIDALHVEFEVERDLLSNDIRALAADLLAEGMAVRLESEAGAAG